MVAPSPAEIPVVRCNERKVEERRACLPTHHAQAQALMKHLGERFGKDVSKIGGSGHLHYVNGTGVKVVLEMVVFQRNMLRTRHMMDFLCGNRNA